MPARKLIERLNREADEEARAIREEAESEAEVVRDEARRKTEALSRRYHEREAEEVEEKIAGITAGAELEAREDLWQAEAALVELLRETAFSLLSELRREGYAAVFKALATEVPESSWKTIRVNPADHDLAAEIFPGADVQGDDSITGGMEAASGDGRVRIVNTFEKRLERAWEQILPGLLAEVYETHAGD